MRTHATLALMLLACGGEAKLDSGAGDDTGDTVAPTTSPTATTPTTAPTTTPDDGWRVDSFTIAPTALDLLFVIDNSCSMAEEQEQLAVIAPQIFEFLYLTDFHLGVVSTDMDSAAHRGKLQYTGADPYLHPDSVDAETHFVSRVIMGTGGSGDEQGRAATYTAISGGSPNKGFIRPDADLHIVVLSDEDDHSGSDPISTTDFADYLNGLDKTVHFSSIVGQEGCCDSVFGDEEEGLEYSWTTDQVGGLHADIQSDDWSNTIDQIGRLSFEDRISFVLAEVPDDLDAIEVAAHIDGITFLFLQHADWNYDAGDNSVNFMDFVPSNGAVIDITYTVAVER
jgi:hypothetical protein